MPLHDGIPSPTTSLHAPGESDHDCRDERASSQNQCRMLTVGLGAVTVFQWQ